MKINKKKKNKHLGSKWKAEFFEAVRECVEHAKRQNYIKEGQIYASYCETFDCTDIILITKEHDELEDFWFYDYEWVKGTYSTSIITPKHLKNWDFIGEL